MPEFDPVQAEKNRAIVKGGYDKIRDTLSRKLFGTAIPPENMEPEQRAQFYKAFESQLQDLASTADNPADVLRMRQQMQEESKQAEATYQDNQFNAKGDDITQKIMDLADENAAGNDQYYDQNVGSELDKLRFAQQGTFFNDQQALAMQGAARDQYSQGYADLAKQAAEAATGYNQQATDLQKQLTDTYAGLDAGDRAALEQYQKETDPLMAQREAQGWGADVGADAEGLAAQRQAMQAALGDVEGGGKDQQDVMERYKALTSPQATAQERYLAEMARRNFEGQDRSNREAVMQNLAQRGLNSGTLQIANNLAAQERLGQDRTLAELGLQANAVGRSMQALEGYGGAANALRSGNQAANTIYGNQANALRTANDALAEFNKTGSQVAQRFQDTYAQDEARRVGDLSGQRRTATTATNEGIGRRAGDASTQGQNVITANSARDTSARGEQGTALTNKYNADTTYNNTFAETGQRAWNRQNELTNTAANLANTRAAGRTVGANTRLEALKLLLGQNASGQATATAKRGGLT